MAYIKRAVEDMALRISDMFPVLLVTGPRQVGKTTLLQKLAEMQRSTRVERKYVSNGTIAVHQNECEPL